MAFQQLPWATQMILPTLAADRGRARASTQLAILGAGPDDVQQHLASTDAALGADGPGSAGLADLMSRTRTASSATAATVPRQHVISEAVLRRLTELIDLRAGKQLMSCDLVTGRSKRIGAGGAGYVMNFVTIDSAATELVWKRVEDSLTEAITAAENDSLLSDPRLVGILRDAIALHHVRHPQTKDVHERIGTETRAQRVSELANTPVEGGGVPSHIWLSPRGLRGNDAECGSCDSAPHRQCRRGSHLPPASRGSVRQDLRPLRRQRAGNPHTCRR